MRRIALVLACFLLTAPGGVAARAEEGPATATPGEETPAVAQPTRAERIDALLEHFAGIAETDLRTFPMQRFGNAPGDGVLVGNAKDESLLPLKQAHAFRSSSVLSR